ncbi:MAG: hypothetical protein CMP38_05695 [Rickettsiales bacterium]|nr:hypothetical protein [Rickettsiales bacterium]OUW00677.1 MAG: hypothetical protein CBD16_06295 [Betaproteobacteria bacterium TMED156]
MSILVWESNQAELIIITNIAICSLILIISSISHGSTEAKKLFVLVFSVITAFFSLSNDENLLRLIGSITISICIISSIIRLIRSNQKKRRENSEKRLSTLLKNLSNNKKVMDQKSLKQSKFLVSVSHDLKQPMHAINLYLGSIERILLKIKMSENEAKNSSKSLQKLKQSVSYMNNILDSVLEASRLEQGFTKIILSQVKVNEFFSKVANQHLKSTREVNLSLEFITTLDDNMTIKSDVRLLERIFRNLISNAIRYTKKGGIRVRLAEEKELIKLSIIDTGPGIHPKMKTFIFNEFTQVDQDISDFGNNKGIGLGLSIVKKLAGRIGAFITLKSRLGIGSIFTLHIPKTKNQSIIKKTDDLESKMLKEVLPHLITIEAKETIVLLVDQDEDSKNAFEFLAPNLGIKLISGLSSNQIISKTTNLKKIPKLLIIDSQNTIEDPLTSIRKIQEEFNQELPVIIVTTDAENESMLTKSNQAVTLLQKPFSSYEFQDSVNKILAKSLEIKTKKVP